MTDVQNRPGKFVYHSNAGMWMDASNPDDTEGGCTMCDVDWAGTYKEVQAEFARHAHDLLTEARYYLDAFPETFGQRGDLVERLWHLAQSGSDR